MPTTRPRHQVTETPEVARALDVAARRWPGRSRGALVTLLLVEGARSVEDGDRHAREARREKLARLAGGFHYEPGYLEELRKDRPE